MGPGEHPDVSVSEKRVGTIITPSQQRHSKNLSRNEDDDTKENKFPRTDKSTATNNNKKNNVDDDNVDGDLRNIKKEQDGDDDDDDDANNDDYLTRTIQNPTARLIPCQLTGGHFNKFAQQLYTDVTILDDDPETFTHTLYQLRNDLSNGTDLLDEQESEQLSKEDLTAVRPFLELGGLPLVTNTYKNGIALPKFVPNGIVLYGISWELSRRIEYTIHDHLLTIIFQFVVQSMMNYPDDANVQFESMQTIHTILTYLAFQIKTYHDNISKESKRTGVYYVRCISTNSESFDSCTIASPHPPPYPETIQFVKKQITEGLVSSVDGAPTVMDSNVSFVQYVIQNISKFTDNEEKVQKVVCMVLSDIIHYSRELQLRYDYADYFIRLGIHAYFTQMIPKLASSSLMLQCTSEALSQLLRDYTSNIKRKEEEQQRVPYEEAQNQEEESSNIPEPTRKRYRTLKSRRRK